MEQYSFNNYIYRKKVEWNMKRKKELKRKKKKKESIKYCYDIAPFIRYRNILNLHKYNTYLVTLNFNNF
jgi:hypothetical protein